MKKGKKYRYLVLSLDADLKNVVTIQKGARDASYDELVALLKDDQPNFIVYDFEYTFDDNGIDRDVSKLILLFWCSDKAKVRQKMVYASTLKEVQSKLLGLQKTLPVNSLGELSYDTILGRVKGN